MYIYIHCIMRMITFLFAKLRPNRTWMKSTQKTRVRMGKIQGGCGQECWWCCCCCCWNTQVRQWSHQLPKKNMRLFTMRRKAIAELTKECSDMQKAGDPGGQERFVHIQLALEQNYSTNDNLRLVHDCAWKIRWSSTFRWMHWKGWPLGSSMSSFW